MRKTLLLLAMAALLGCGDQAAKGAVRKLLHDPDSATFSGITAGKVSGDYCGFVNAKNRMGGYSGNTPFYYIDAVGLAGFAPAPEQSEFRSIWLSMKAGDAFEKPLKDLVYKCHSMKMWDQVCAIRHPEEMHRLCPVLLDKSSDVYAALKAEFD